MLAIHLYRTPIRQNCIQQGFNKVKEIYHSLLPLMHKLSIIFTVICY
jgi:hypothetical protein